MTSLLGALFPLFISTFLIADDNIPKIPEAAPIKEHTGGKSAEEFFKERFESAPCKEGFEAYSKQRDSFEKKRSELIQRVAKKKDESENIAIADLEKSMLSDRREMLKYQRACGECVVSVQKSPKGQGWYESVGVCVPRQEFKPANSFKKISESLQQPKRYARRIDEGSKRLEIDSMSNLFNFIVTTDPAKGELKPVPQKDELAVIKDNSFYSFVSVASPFSTVLSYLGKNEVTLTEDSLHILYTRYEKVIPAEFYKFLPNGKTIQKYTATGSTSNLSSVEDTFLKNNSPLIASWYVNKEGYTRYWTAAKFTQPDVIMSAGHTLAEGILRETVLEVTERAYRD